MSDNNQIIDLRSDTVTRPCPAMYAAMAEAPLGDDVYGGDPTVARLEETAADLLGLEAGLFLPSGTQSNLVALMTHCGRGEEYIAGDQYHVFKAEAGGAAVLGSIAPHPLPLDDQGRMDLAEIERTIKPDDPHCPITRLICLENTHNGRAVAPDHSDAVVKLAQAKGLAVHIDGARLMNAAVGLGENPARLVRGADSVSLCLSKSLGAPVGSVLLGSTEFIHQARRVRKMVGGGLRQSGLLAACGLVALERNIERLSEDHALADALARELSGVNGVTVEGDRAFTNMVYLQVAPEHYQPLCDHLEKQGILARGPAPRLRLVLHLDVPPSALDRIVQGIHGYFSENG